MDTELITIDRTSMIPTRIARQITPMLFTGTQKAEKRFWEFFAVDIRNPNTRLAYLTAAYRFADWCEVKGLTLEQVEPMLVAAYIEQLTTVYAPATVKQYLAAIRMLFDWLVSGQVVPFNPASSVRGPKHVVKTGKTPVLTAGETRDLLDAIDTGTLVGVRDRALIGSHGVQLRTRERGGGDAGVRLLHARQALVLPVARKRRQVPRGAGAPRRPGVHR